MGTHPIFESDFDCLTDFEMPIATIIQAYSTFLVMGALIGFFKKRSLPPLVAAIVLTIIGFYAAGIENKHPKTANRISGMMALSMAVYMGSHFLKTGKFMHAGLVSLISLAVLFITVRRAY